MRYYSDFARIEEVPDEPLVIHRHGDQPGRALIILAHGLGGTRYGTWTPNGSEATVASLPKFLYDDIDGLEAKLEQELGERCHLFLKRKNRRRDERAPSAASRRAMADMGLVGAVALVCEPGPVRDSSERLLEAPDPAIEL